MANNLRKRIVCHPCYSTCYGQPTYQIRSL